MIELYEDKTLDLRSSILDHLSSIVYKLRCFNRISNCIRVDYQLDRRPQRPLSGPIGRFGPPAKAKRLSLPVERNNAMRDAFSLPLVNLKFDLVAPRRVVQSREVQFRFEADAHRLRSAGQKH